MTHKNILVLPVIILSGVILFPGCSLNKGDISPGIDALTVSGEFTDGAAVTISGSNFGENNLDIEWLGGKDGHIEQGIEDAVLSKERWSESGSNGGFNSTVYDNSRAHSNSKALKSSINSSESGESKWSSFFRYDHGEKLSAVYSTWWVYINPAEFEGGQWKMWRLRPYPDVNDREGEIMSSSWFEEDHSHMQQYVMLIGDDVGGAYQSTYPDENGRLRWLEDEDVPDTGQWARIEVYAEESSAQGQRDGTFIYRIYKQNVHVKNICSWEKNIITRTNTPDRWQYFIFQNYWGNKTADNADIWIDDIYISTSRARVELCDTANWADRTHSEIQKPAAWSGSSISFEMNKGSFSAGDTAYIFVIDADGSVSNGQKIIIE